MKRLSRSDLPMYGVSKCGPIWVLLLTLLIASPAILATATANTGRGEISSLVNTDSDVEMELPDASEDREISGEFFVSPLTDVRYLIRKNPEADRMWFCRTDDGFCYQSINEILTDESKNMPGWMLKVAPSLREQITESISERGTQESEIRIIIELDEKHFHDAAEEVWNDRNNELEGVMEGLADLGPSEGTAPNDLSGTLDRDLLDQLDLILDEARSDIYILAEESTLPLVSRLTAQISTVGGVVVGHTLVLPALFATVPADSIQKIALMDGVDRITEDGTMEAMMDVSSYSVRADTWWTNGFTGVWDLAVVDTGIDGTHPALTVDFAKVFHAQGQGSGSYADDPTDPDDLFGHGTHIAGTVTSVDSIYQGVAYGMEALINAKAGYKRSGGGASMSWSDGMSAVDWAVNTAGADAISFSFGGNPGSGDTPYSRFYDAVADDLGVTVVLVAGNAGPGST
ncbi:MAG: S8/S53 family peptidase, partial [Thermoplasmata archaeon]